MKEKLKYYLLLFVILGAVIFVYLFQWFGPGIISQYKQNKEMEQIHYGGSTEEANASIELTNKKIDELKEVVDSALRANTHIYVFTNDTTRSLDKMLLFPKMDYDVFEPPTFMGRPVITRNEEVIEEIDLFLTYQDSLGYYGNIIKDNHTLHVKGLKKEKEHTIFKLITYFKPTAAYNDRPIIKSGNKFKHLLSEKKDSFETRNFLYKESHLTNANERVRYNAAILSPYYKGFYDDSFRFYFVCYNSNVSREELQNRADFVMNYYLKDLDCRNCHIRELKVATTLY
jgi:hypothetical protein